MIYLTLQYNTLHYREYDLLTLTTVRFDESCGCAFKRDEWTPGRCNSCCNQSRAEVEKHCDNWTGKIIWNRNRSNQTRECWSDLISRKVAPTIVHLVKQVFNCVQFYLDVRSVEKFSDTRPGIGCVIACVHNCRLNDFLVNFWCLWSEVSIPSASPRK